MALLGSTHNLTNVIGVVSTPIIQHSEGKKSQGFGDRVPYSTKRQKKSHSRRMALKSWFEDLASDNRFFMNDMTNLCQISQKASGETSQSFNRDSLCSYLPTTDTSKIVAYQKNLRQAYLRDEEPDTTLQKTFTKKITNWARRKITAQEIAYQLAEHEKQLPIKLRDSRNRKKSYQYEPIQENGIVKTNRFGDPIFKPTKRERETSTFYNLGSNVGNQRRYMRMFYCRDEYVPKKDKKTNKIVYRPTSQCGNKLCPNCNQVKTITAIQKYMPLAEQMKDPVMLVLHASSPMYGELKWHLDEMNNTLRSIFKVRAKSGKEHFFGILSLEITSNPRKGTFHPHFHIIIERHLAKELFDAWINHKDNLVKDKGAHINKKTKRIYSEITRNNLGELNLNEVFKYVLKISISTKNKDQDKTFKQLSLDKMVYEIDKVLKGKKTYRPFGKWSNRKKAINDMIEENKIQSEPLSEVEIPPTHGFIALADKWIWKGHDWEAENIPGLMLSGFIPNKHTLSFINPSAETIRYFQRGIQDGKSTDFQYLDKWEIERARLLLELQKP